MKKCISIALVVLVFAALAPGQTVQAKKKVLRLIADGDKTLAQTALPAIDRLRLAEAFRIGDTFGDRVWTDWSKAPFAVLLITPDSEFLIRHPRPSPEFILAGYDPLLKSNVYYRKRTQPTNLLATFPIVGGTSTIVIGQAENTAKKSSTPWVVTVLHEHFHQLQQSQQTYYQDVNALDLSRGDQSGMWMLNYPFPYDWAELKQHFSDLSRLLAEALEAKSKSAFYAKLSAYLAARQELGKVLSPDDYRYFSFQVWQEGIARYTEYRIAEIASGKYKPSKEFRALSDYKTFGEVAAEIRRGIIDTLSTSKLDESRRVTFYALGAGEGLLLDRINPHWRKRYLVDKFYVDRYFEAKK
jgi:hypothetical protein